MIQNKLESMSAEDVASGIKIVLESAKQLIADGDVLYREERFSRAYTLYQLAIEEIGKSRLLCALLIAIKTAEEINYQEYNKEFTDHKRKSKGAITYEMIPLLLMFKSESSEEKKKAIQEAYKALTEERQNLDELNNRKNYSLYVSIIDGSFKTPEQMISDEMASYLRTNAIIRLKAASTFIEFTLDNIEILCTTLKKMKENPEHLLDPDFAELILSVED